MRPIISPWRAALADALARRGHNPPTREEIAAARADKLTPTQAADQIAAMREADTAADKAVAGGPTPR